MNLKEFLVFFDRVLKKIQKTNPNFSEEDLLKMVINNWEVAKEKVKMRIIVILNNFKTHNWEQKLLSIRDELRKARTAFEEDKTVIITKKLKENPDLPLEELDRELAKTGFFGIDFLRCSFIFF